MQRINEEGGGEKPNMHAATFVAGEGAALGPSTSDRDDALDQRALRDLCDRARGVRSSPTRIVTTEVGLDGLARSPASATQQHRDPTWLAPGSIAALSLVETGVVIVDRSGRLLWAYWPAGEPMEELPLHAMYALDPGIPIAYLRTKSGATLRVRACGILADALEAFGDSVSSRPRPLAPRGRASYTEPHARMFLLEHLWGDGPVLTALLAGFGFTPREAEIALLTVRGLSNKQIARTLGGLSGNSVRDCLRIYGLHPVCKEKNTDGRKE